MIREIIGTILIGLGVIAYIIAVIGNFKFKYILNRMHAAGIGDSLALGLVIIGCVIINGICITSIKLICVCLFLYFTSPVCSHMLAKLEADINDNLANVCEIVDIPTEVTPATVEPTPDTADLTPAESDATEPETTQEVDD